MSYKVDPYEHQRLVNGIFDQWTLSSPNMFFISSDGHKILTHKIIISFLSPMMKDILESMHMEVGITVDAPSSQILIMLKVLTKGIAGAGNKEDLEQISLLVQSMGIDFKNWQIGSRKKSQAMSISRKKQIAKMINVFNISNKAEIQNMTTEAQGKTTGSLHNYQCNDCGKNFQNKKNYNRHKVIHSDIRFGCRACSFTSKRKDTVSTHIRGWHRDINFDELLSTITSKEDTVGLKQEMLTEEIQNESSDDTKEYVVDENGVAMDLALVCH